MKISAKIVADSINPQGDRLTTMLVTFPRFILAELNTHRILSKNSASSRAIPTHKLLKMVEEDPFIPIAWQKEHKGMQGTGYLLDNDAKLFEDSNEIEHYTKTSVGFAKQSWLHARDSVIKYAKELNNIGCTKQIANRLLEPFMWHTVLISGTEWKNFFDLRCPQYEIDLTEAPYGKKETFKSKKEVIEFLADSKSNGVASMRIEGDTDLDWLKRNKGQAEIHMMALAEAIYDAIKESTPKQLQAGEWHIPFEDRIDLSQPMFYNGAGKDNFIFTDKVIKISTAMAARTSYTVVGDEKEVSYDTLLGIHDKMSKQVPFHASPFEHCAKVMSNSEYEHFLKGTMENIYNKGYRNTDKMEGWCRNFKGFIQYRHILENN